MASLSIAAFVPQNSGTRDLTALGAVDWIHWTSPSTTQRKSGGGSTFSAYTVVIGSDQGYTNSPQTFSWTDGTPTGTGSDTNGVNNTSFDVNGAGYSFTAVADTSTRVVRVGVGEYDGTGTLTCTLSDGSAGPSSLAGSSSGPSNVNEGYFDVTFQAASAGQTITFQWVTSADAGGDGFTNASIQYAALVSVTASGGTTVTPGVKALSLGTFAPTLAQTANQSVAPGVKALTLATFAPTLAQGGNQALTPGAGALTLATFAPTISQPQTASPGVLALTLATFAPTVSQPIGVAPAAGALVLTTYAPTVQIAAGSQGVAPGVGALVLATYAPTVSQASIASDASGGFPDMPRRSGQKYEQWVRQQRIALGIVEPEPIAQLAPPEMEVASKRAMNELAAFQGLAKRYQAQIEQRAQADIGEKRMAREIARIQQQMDSARAHAETVARQIEEIDVVYVARMLAEA